MTDPVTEQQIDRAFYRDVAERYAGYGNPSIPAEHLLALLDQLEQAEADRDRNLRSSRLAKEGRIKANARADQAEARIKAVRDLHRPYGDTLTGLYICTACDQPCPCPTIRAVESVPPPRA